MARNTWALVKSQEYDKEFSRLQPKYQSQIARKEHDLMNDPTPGGSRTLLMNYHGLNRLRAGDFRIIYAYNDSVVELLSLRRRNESTYDELDLLEVEQFQMFRRVGAIHPANHRIPEWEQLAANYAAPEPKVPELLPRPITKAMLEELNIPDEYRESLLSLSTVDDLLGCEVPADVRTQILDFLLPKSEKLLLGDPRPVVVLEDLVDAAAANVSGPIDASDHAAAQSFDGAQSTIDASLEVPKPLVLIPTRRNQTMLPYPGNITTGIARDGHYTVTLDRTIRLKYTVNQTEYVLLTTDGHDELVALVNNAKRQGGANGDGGSFYINEYRHVLVPTPSGHLFAGVYTRDLEFVFPDSLFRDSLVSPVAPPGIRPGDVWPGPHVGMKYVLTADTLDIRYEVTTLHGTTIRILLSQFYPAHELADLLKMFRLLIPNGGTIYINEARECFAPVAGHLGYERQYIGHIGSRQWFPDPTSESFIAAQNPAIPQPVAVPTASPIVQTAAQVLEFLRQNPEILSDILRQRGSSVILSTLEEAIQSGNEPDLQIVLQILRKLFGTDTPPPAAP